MSKQLLFLLFAGTVLRYSARTASTPVSDPCENYCCPPGQYCYPQPIECLIAPCPPPIARCRDPCENNPCKANEVCVAKKQKGELRAVCENPCRNYECSAAQTCTTKSNELSQTVPMCLGPCSRVRCAGGTCVDKLTSNGTAYPQCYPPPPKEYSPCYNSSQCRCSKKETCIVISSSVCSKPPCPYTPAATCACSNPCQGKTCNVSGEYCYLALVYKSRHSYSAVPYCSDPCKWIKCKRGTVCVRKQYEDYRYSPYAVCQSPCADVYCPITKKCKVMKEGEQMVAKCIGPCDSRKCRGRCVERINKKGKVYAKCYSRPEPDPCSGCQCSGNETCVLTSRQGDPSEFFAQCTVNPCESSERTKDGKYCYPSEVTCVRAPCYPVPEYRRPCDRVNCKPGTKCVVKKYKCASGYCPPQGRCE